MEGWKDGRMEGWKEQPHLDHRALRASFFPAAHEGVKILTLPLLSGLILGTHGLARWTQRGGAFDRATRLSSSKSHAEVRNQIVLVVLLVLVLEAR